MRDASVFMFVVRCTDWFEAARFRRLLRRVDSTIESLENTWRGYASFSTEQLEENLKIGTATLAQLNCEIVARYKEAEVASINSDKELLSKLYRERKQLERLEAELEPVTEFFENYQSRRIARSANH